MSMREKIALAVANADDNSHVVIGRGAFTNAEWKGFEKIADAVLDALLEPTIGMVSEGQDAVYNGGASPGPVHIPMTTCSFSVIFQAMIRAAKEGK